MADTIPIIAINGCEAHSTVSPGVIGIVETGPDSSQSTRDFIYDLLTCWKCWARDERGMLAATQALHMTPEMVVELRRLVMRKRTDEEAPQ